MRTRACLLGLLLLLATLPAFAGPTRANTAPITQHTNSSTFARALLRAANSRSLGTVKAAFVNSPRYFGRQVSGKTRDNMINSYVFGCVRKYGGWQFHLDLLDGKKVLYASEKYQPGEVDQGGEGEYSSLWILTRVNGKYWRVAEITNM